jgi:hypothetical protein
MKVTQGNNFIKELIKTFGIINDALNSNNAIILE